MTKIRLLPCFILILGAIDVDGTLLKHLTPRPGGIIDSLTRPRQPGGFQLGSRLGGGISFGLGSFGFNFGFNKQYVPGGVNRPPKEPHIPDGETGYPDGNPYVPGVKPDYPGGNPNIKPGYPDGNPYVPGVKPGYPDGNTYVPGVKPGYPDGNPYVPNVKPGYPEGNPYVPNVKPGYPDSNPYIPNVKPGYPEGNPYIPGSRPLIPQNPEIKPSEPSITWEDEEDEKKPYYPPPKEKGDTKPGSYENGKKDKFGPYEDTDSPKREDRPNWEDIGEDYGKDVKSENLMNSDLVGDGLLQPRLQKNRSKRFIESKIYHVPLLFRSNAKPDRVKISNNLNSLEKESLKK